MLIDIARLALPLGALLGAWAVVASVTAFVTGRGEYLTSARRATIAATALAACATVVLSFAIYATELSVRFVAERWSLLIPARYVLAALLSEAGGAMTAFAAGAGAVGLLVTRRLPGTTHARAWPSGVLGATIAVALLVASLAGPFTAVVGVHSDGAGLDPHLQRGAVVLQAVALIATASAAVAPFLLTVAALAAREVGDAWSKSVRPANAAALTFVVVGLVAASRSFQVDPLRGPWLADRATTVWLIVAATAAWLVHLDRRGASAERAVMRLLLTAALFITATGALAITGAAFARGPVVVARPATSLFAVLPAAALVVVVALLRGGKGAVAGAGNATSAPGNAMARGLVRAGAAVLAIVAAGSFFTRVAPATLGDSEIFRVRDPFGAQWSFRSQGVSTLTRENYATMIVSLLPQRDSSRLRIVNAEARSYLLADNSDAAPPLMVSDRLPGLLQETRIGIVDPDGRRPTLTITFVPFGSWLLAGAALFVTGVALLAIPHRRSAV